MYKPTAVEALWFLGGNLALSRFCSKILALQLKARMEGIPCATWGVPRAAWGVDLGSGEKMGAA
jgi:putative flavoprotein involved in K+ transport